jgi:hypothetical protein
LDSFDPFLYSNSYSSLFIIANSFKNSYLILQA